MADFVFGCIGDSITAGNHLSAGQDPVTYCQTVLTATGRYASVTGVNQGVPSSATADWLPNSTNLNTAKTAFSGASVTHVLIMLGANDSVAPVAPATYSANLSAIAGNLIGAGYLVVLDYCTYMASPGPTLPQTYLAVIDDLVNGTTILHGDRDAYLYFRNNPSQLQSDGVHPTAAGSYILGLLWARGISDAVS
jgi:lysophospholipase L1-like esterase